MEQLTKQEILEKLISAIEDNYFGNFSTVETIYSITIEGEHFTTTPKQLLEDFDTLDEESKNYIINNY